MTDNRDIMVIYPDPKTLPPNFGDIQLVDGIPQVDLIHETVDFEQFADRMQGLQIVDTMRKFPDSGSVTLTEPADLKRWYDTKP